MWLTAIALVVVSQTPPSAAQWGQQIFIADGHGTVRAWRADTLQPETGLTARLSSPGMLAITRDADVLWGFTGPRVFSWNAAQTRWDEVRAIAPLTPCTRFAVVDGAPIGFSGLGVHRFTDGRFWATPPSPVLLHGPEYPFPFRGFGSTPRLVAHGAVLAIGTTFGEWGGHLWLLDTARGTWSVAKDDLGNVAGIAWRHDSWAVAWSMSHLGMEDTRVRIHGADADPRHEGGLLDGHLLRALTFEEATNTLAGIDHDDLVRVDDKLGLKRIRSLGNVAYAREPMAVGVASGIAEFLPIGGGRFLVVPFRGDALVASSSAVVHLAGSSLDGGVP